jgi:coatomer protein complex subunit gamma
VRDRATLYLNLLGNGPENVSESAQSLIFERLDVPLANLEASLQSYEPSERPFDVAAVSTEVKPQPFTEKKAPTSKKAGKDTNQKVTANGGGLPGHKTSDSYERLLNSIPEFAGFGKLFKSSPIVELTEAETEYSVDVIKHIYPGHVVFQFNCTNTIAEYLLENVSRCISISGLL